MESKCLVLLLCLGTLCRTKAQTKEVSNGEPKDISDTTNTLESSDDQQVSSAIISVSYRDKSGKLKTVKTKSNKLKLKRRKPKKVAKLKKSKGKYRV